ncbi:alpha/beta fold hydrolase [Rhodococcus sp. NPDC003348]
MTAGSAATDREIPSDTAPLGPDSVAWSVFGDLTFVLGATHRLLVDVAHPTVATGVREFSVFATDPYGRAQRTLDMIMGVVYGREDALAAARALRERHRDIKGRGPDGRRWSSLDAEAFHWVHASLVHGVHVQQRVLGRGWRPGEAEQFYLEMRRVGRMYGIRERDMPADWPSFLAWFGEMTASRLERSDVTDQVLAVAGSPSPPPIPVLRLPVLWNHTVRPIAGAVLTLVTAGLLTPELRELFGLRWTRGHHLAFTAVAAVSRTVLPRLPRTLRLVPQARKAVTAARSADLPHTGATPYEVLSIRSADGTRLHTEIHGNDTGPTVVLAHGVLCSTEFWHNQIRDLADDFRVVAYDHRGHGRSEAPKHGHYSLDHLAADLHAVLAATVPDGETAIVAGHSMGGIAVMHWAARYPEDVSAKTHAVALVNTTPGEILDHVRFLRGPHVLSGTRRRVAHVAAPLAGLPLPERIPLRRQLVARVSVAAGADATVGRRLDRVIGATPARGRRGYGTMLVDLVDSLDPAAVTVPTVVIAGRHDRIAPLPRSRYIAERLPALLELHEVDSGHCAPLERPDVVTAALRDLATPASVAEAAR